jgi:hypothetical protein
MLSSMNTMIVCLLAGTKIFNLNVEPEIKQMFDQWQKLARKDKKNKAASQGSQR